MSKISFFHKLALNVFAYLALILSVPVAIFVDVQKGTFLLVMGCFAMLELILTKPINVSITMPDQEEPTFTDQPTPPHQGYL